MNTENLFFQKRSSIASDGSRKKIRLAEVAGRFTSFRTVTFIVLIAIYALLPIVKIDGYPIIFIDILHRRFYLAGHTFNPQDFYMVFFFITGGALVLFYITAIVGRVWCSWACPQTVFLEGVFRRIERWIEGPRSAQLTMIRDGWNLKRISKLIIKHFLFVIVAVLTANIFISYFISLDQLLIFVKGDPREHLEAFLWMAGIAGIMYFNFGWFREQLCLIVCPYGRIQSALTDDDTIVIGYDSYRGEPRGKKSDEGRGDCINCFRCVDVCPTGIDIRNGLQLECIGCANCVDACDDIMKKVGQKTGLVRYDSLNGLAGKKRTILRPRIYLYTALMLVGFLVFSLFLSKRNPFEANVLRMQGAPYTLTEGLIRNQYSIHLINKTSQDTTFLLHPDESTRLHFILPFKQIRLKSLESRMVPMFAEINQDDFKGDFEVILKTTDIESKKSVISRIMFLGP